MQILFLTQLLPYPLDAGAKVRAYYMLRHLAGRHAVTLVSFVRPDDPPAALAHLGTICAAVHGVPIRRSAWRNVRAGAVGLLTGLPITIARDESAEMAALLRRLVAGNAFDVIHADQLSMAGWGMRAGGRGSGGAGERGGRGAEGPRLLLDEHNAIYLLAERMAADERNPLRKLIMRREAAAFRRYETAMLQAYDAVLTVTEEDREHLEALLEPGSREQASEGRGQRSEGRGQASEGRGQASEDISHSTFDIPHSTSITAIPICVDPEQVAVVPRGAGGAPTILHLGTMFWPPNVAGVLWFARAVLPLVHAAVPEARFVIVGKNPPAEVQALTADPRIEVTGYVADTTPYLAAADAFVVPLHAGGGMRVKIVDAWLWGLPIVSTSIGAEGIARHDGDDILLADGAAAFAAATVRLLTDPALNARLRAAGRAWVEAKYAWQNVYPRVDAVYAALAR